MQIGPQLVHGMDHWWACEKDQKLQSENIGFQFQTMKIYQRSPSEAKSTKDLDGTNL